MTRNARERNPTPVSIQSDIVTISGNVVQAGAQVIHGLAADRPTAAAAHAVLPFAYYNAVDTQVLTQTDGTNWVTV